MHFAGTKVELHILKSLNTGKSLTEVSYDNDGFCHASRLAFMYTFTFDVFIFMALFNSVKSENANDYINF
ncbi:hypothetical protein SPIRO4BDMA_50857 [uncultured spirochete]|uniref:Uncharacterized protein n=1 Tax=uncultured spirochete TaxID=156406 RepID=A0A3P3XST4_9SPIR|nr:hypothetical protein SPIRO4BDMA_50857 [uncultured spirochete]